MTKSRLPLVLLSLLAAAVVAAQTPGAAPAKPADKTDDTCMKHGEKMAESCEKMMASQKAMKEKHDAAWKEIETQLAAAKTATGEKKVAALESAVEKLVAFHGETQKTAGGMACCAGMSHEAGAMAGHHAGMGHEMGMMGHGMMENCPCCKGGMAPPAGKS